MKHFDFLTTASIPRICRVSAVEYEGSVRITRSIDGDHFRPPATFVIPTEAFDAMARAWVNGEAKAH